MLPSLRPLTLSSSERHLNYIFHLEAALSPLALVSLSAASFVDATAAAVEVVLDSDASEGLLPFRCCWSPSAVLVLVVADVDLDSLACVDAEDNVGVVAADDDDDVDENGWDNVTDAEELDDGAPLFPCGCPGAVPVPGMRAGWGLGARGRTPKPTPPGGPQAMPIGGMPPEFWLVTAVGRWMGVGYRGALPLLPLPPPPGPIILEPPLLPLFGPWGGGGPVRTEGNPGERMTDGGPG